MRLIDQIEESFPELISDQYNLQITSISGSTYPHYALVFDLYFFLNVDI